MTLPARIVVTLAVLLAVALTGAQGMDESGELPSLEEIDRQLNNPLSKTWALTFQDNLGINQGEAVDGSATSNVLFF